MKKGFQEEFKEKYGVYPNVIYNLSLTAKEFNEAYWAGHGIKKFKGYD